MTNPVEMTRPPPRLEGSPNRWTGAGRSEGAALCHSAPGGPARPRPGRSEGRERPGGDARPDRAHQRQIEMQVVARVEPAAPDLVAAVEVSQIGAAIVPAGVARTVRIDGPEIVRVRAVADVDDSARHEQVAVAGVASGDDAVEEVDAAFDRLHDVLRETDA